MSTYDSFEALRRANPRANPDFATTVAAAADAVQARIAEAGATRRRGVLRPALVAAAMAAAAATAFLAGSVVYGTEVESAAAALRQATAVSAASADRSGRAVVRITHDGELWAATTIRWHGDDVSIANDAPQRVRTAGSETRVVDGMLYGIEDGEWVELGAVSSIDRDSGTTPGEYLAAVRDDVGGETLRRLTRGMSEPTTRTLVDGSIVYSGHVAARLVARETGTKGGRPIRVLPFGYVAHGAAANPDAALAVALTVDANDVVRNVTLTWGNWTYSVAYEDLGAAAEVVAPENARPLRRATGG